MGSSFRDFLYLQRFLCNNLFSIDTVCIEYPNIQSSQVGIAKCLGCLAKHYMKEDNKVCLVMNIYAVVNELTKTLVVLFSGNYILRSYNFNNNDSKTAFYLSGMRFLTYTTELQKRKF